MFGIGTGELILIFIVALIILGPQKLPEIASKLGRAYGTFRRLSTQFQRTLNSEIADLEEEKKYANSQENVTENIPSPIENQPEIQEDFSTQKEVLSSIKKQEETQDILTTEIKNPHEESFLNEEDTIPSHKNKE
ncbi:MAG: twin-arginine translocase TatA/TatE family subunit [Desulfovibrionaceae bacterium]